MGQTAGTGLLPEPRGSCDLSRGVARLLSRERPEPSLELWGVGEAVGSRPEGCSCGDVWMASPSRGCRARAHASELCLNPAVPVCGLVLCTQAPHPLLQGGLREGRPSDQESPVHPALLSLQQLRGGQGCVLSSGLLRGLRDAVSEGAFSSRCRAVAGGRGLRGRWFPGTCFGFFVLFWFGFLPFF